MKKYTTLAAVTLFSIFDFVAATLFYCNGAAFQETFAHALSRYSFGNSVFELWVLSLLRISVILGVVIGSLKTAEISTRRVKHCWPVALTFAAVQCMFTLIKLLSISENSQFLQNKWFWCIFTWTLLSSIIFAIQWVVISRITVTTSRTLNINNKEVDHESDSLLGKQNPDGVQQPLTSEAEDNRRSRKGTILRLISYSRSDWYLILIGFIFLVISAAGEIFIPFFTGRVVDGIIIEKSQKMFTDAIITMALISVGSALAAFVRALCLGLAVRRLNVRIKNTLFASILSQEVGFFDTVQTGEITSRLTSDTTTMSDALGLNVNIFLRNFINATGVIFFMFKLCWQLTIVTFIGFPCILGLSKVYGNYYEKLSTAIQDSLAQVNNVAEEACSTMTTVKSFANERGEVKRYAEKLGLTYKLNKKEALLYAAYLCSSMVLQLALTVSILYYGGHLVISGTISGGTLISFILYQMQLGDCLNNIGNVYTGLMQASGASKKVLDYIDRIPKLICRGNHAPDNIQGKIEFKDVCFSYPSRPNVQVLKNISFTVAPGEVVALVGPSGGGKTSCVKLLEYFYAPQSGQVLLDNVPIHQYDHHYLHKQISLVGQEPILYARSIEENICYGLNADEFSLQSVANAASLANAHKFITELKDGYKTQTGEKGMQMSGGQKQRIAIARALLRKPHVLLLDEATSALDSESEYLVQQALYQNFKGRTVIIIAHRLSTVEKANRIIVIDKGCVVEQGSHSELLKSGKIYANLVRRQLLVSEEVSYNKSHSIGTSRSLCECSRRHRCSCHYGIHACDNEVCSNDVEQKSVTFILGSV